MDPASLLFIYTETPLHVGSGDGSGAIDLPIQRERGTGLPIVPGSGIKGALRESFFSGAREDTRKQAMLAMFGPEPPSGQTDDRKNQTDAEDKGAAPTFAGSIAVLEARLLLFPVRSAYGGWAWLTSPMLLDRLARDLALVGITENTLADVSAKVMLAGGCLFTTDSAVAIGGSSVVLEDLQVAGSSDRQVDTLATTLAKLLPAEPCYAPFRARLAKQLVVMEDTELCHFTRIATEVNTRVRLDSESHTVQRGALWTEEALPAESLLWSTLFFSRSRNKAYPAEASAMRELFHDSGPPSRIFLGGDRSVGRGLVGLSTRKGGAA
ncbi:MAG: type III-B CRISPR module RAMP protein Cmr4 [Alphaproteobacteria bacterium]|nr:type III-B CRISPR module RAMP protein Cmr4 [Alphaproteobacteria bacterium]